MGLAAMIKHHTPVESVEMEQLREQLACYQSWVAAMSAVVEAGARGDMEQRVLPSKERLS